MSERNTVLRSMHDIGLAGWFGGSLMGAVGLNGAAAQAPNPAERLQIASAGWDRWAPVNLAAIGAQGRTAKTLDIYFIDVMGIAVIEPHVRFKGEVGEQATMFFLDPFGNALEFKSFKHPEHVFTA